MSSNMLKTRIAQLLAARTLGGPLLGLAIVAVCLIEQTRHLIFTSTCIAHLALQPFCELSDKNIIPTTHSLHRAFVQLHFEIGYGVIMVKDLCFSHGEVCTELTALRQ